MPFKIFAGVVAVVLMLAYLLPPVFKLKEIDERVGLLRPGALPIPRSSP